MGKLSIIFKKWRDKRKEAKNGLQTILPRQTAWFQSNLRSTCDFVGLLYTVGTKGT